MRALKCVLSIRVVYNLIRYSSLVVKKISLGIEEFRVRLHTFRSSVDKSDITVGIYHYLNVITYTADSRVRFVVIIMYIVHLKTLFVRTHAEITSRPRHSCSGRIILFTERHEPIHTSRWYHILYVRHGSAQVCQCFQKLYRMTNNVFVRTI